MLNIQTVTRAANESITSVLLTPATNTISIACAVRELSNSTLTLAPQPESVDNLCSLNNNFDKIPATRIAMGAERAESKSWSDMRAYIADERNFRHEINGLEIGSKDLNAPSFLQENTFYNKFEPKQWTFISNMRLNKEVPYHANDIARYQYEVISQKNNFSGVMPEMIKRVRVITPETLKKTEGKKGNELSESFFNTPHGKTTQHILHDFSLTARHVERYESNNSVDFHISLKK